MVTCCKYIHCRRLRCSDLDLTHEDPSLFIKSQLPLSFGHWIVLTWNLAWFIFFATVLLVDIFLYTVEQRHLWPVYLSNWTFLLTVCTTMVEVLARMYRVKIVKLSLEEHTDGIHWCQKVQWTVFNTHNVVSITSMIVYFSVSNIDMALPSVTKHVLASVYVILNTSIISSLPVKLFHFYQPAIFFLFYAIFISIYQNVSQGPADLWLDWNNSQRSAVILTCIVIGSLLLHIVFYCAFRLRGYIFKMCSTNKNKSSREIPVTIQRDITATDVILEPSGSPDFIDYKPDVKDDISLKSRGYVNGDAFKRFDGRLYKSETDLRDYRLKNGHFCEFARSSLVFHTSSSLKSTREIFGHNEPRCHTDSRFDDTDNATAENKGSQIIVVKEYQNYEQSDEGSGVTEEDQESDASSDYLSQYITEDLLAYL